VGRTSVEAAGEVVEAIGEDLAALGEAMVGEDPVALSEAAVMEVWRRTQRSGRVRCGPGGSR
jgi:hypothetical protein